MDKDDIAYSLLVFCIIFLFGWSEQVDENNNLRKEIVAHGAAHYETNGATGEKSFIWNTNR